MNISLVEQLKSVTSLEDAQLGADILGYFDAASRDEAHDLILSLFTMLSKDRGITRAFLARRTGKSPEQITRLLSAPGNWTLETFTHLALAMGYKPKHALERIADMRQSNEHHPPVSRALLDDPNPPHPSIGAPAKIDLRDIPRSPPPAFRVIQSGEFELASA